MNNSPTTLGIGHGVEVEQVRRLQHYSLTFPHPPKHEYGWLAVVPRCLEVIRPDDMEGAPLPAPAFAAPALLLR